MCLMGALSIQLYFIASPIDLSMLILMNLISCTDESIRLKGMQLKITCTHKV